MLARIRKAQENDEGFTLIELLVVMIIIGILAAIAIPTFLSQKQNGYRSQATSDLRNAITNAEAHAVNNNGSYVGMGTPTTAGDNTTAPYHIGISAKNTAITVATTPALSATDFCLSAESKSDSSVVVSYRKSTDTTFKTANCV